MQRVDLESKLAQVAVSQDELKQYVSFTAVQTKGLKKYLRESEVPLETNAAQEEGDTDSNKKIINSLRGVKRRRLALILEPKKKKISDPNVLGLDVSTDFATF